MTLTGEVLMALFLAYGYWIVFTAILLDNAGLPIPGELLLLTFGVVAKAGHLDVVLGLLVAAAAALAGDNIGYWIGRLAGGRLLAERGALRFTPGRASVVFGRFVIGARVLLAPVAGLTRMSFPRFLALDALGCLVWASVFILIGYGSGVRLEVIQHGFRVVSIAAQVLIVGGLAVWLVSRVVLLRRRRTA